MIRRFSFLATGVWIAITTIAIFLGGFGVDANGCVFVFTDLARFVGGVSGVSSLLLGVGWIVNKWVMVSWGLMLAAAVFISRFVLYMTESGPNTFPMWISLALSFLTVGAWIVERDRAVSRGGGGV